MSAETIGQRARRLRLALGLKISNVAESARVDPATVGTFERDLKAPSMFTFIEIARALGVSLDYLAYGEDHGTQKH